MAMEGKVIVITGASSGIGEAAARELASKGAYVVLGARREERLELLKQTIEHEGGKAIYKTTDVTKRREVEALVNEAVQTYGRVDVMINNAGISLASNMSKTNVNEWDSMIDVNLKGVLYGIAAALPPMLKQKEGHIISISSEEGHETAVSNVVYSATKRAVRVVMDGLRKEVQPDDNIKATTISPGVVATELTDHLTDEDLLNMMDNYILGPSLYPEDVANAITYVIEQPDHVAVNEMLVRPKPHQ